MSERSHKGTERVGHPSGEVPSSSSRSTAASGKRAPNAAKAGAPFDPSSAAPSTRRGRPPGSVSLTAKIQTTILNYIRAGAMAYVAAEAAGISERTFRDWMERGEGRHATRKPTPKLRRFAREVRQAQAEARVAAEVRAHQDDYRYWLSRVARSRPGREGWTEPVPGKGGAEEKADSFDARAVLAAKLDAIVARSDRMHAEEQDPAPDRPRPHVVRDTPTSEPRRRRTRKEAT